MRAQEAGNSGLGILRQNPSDPRLNKTITEMDDNTQIAMDTHYIKQGDGVETIQPSDKIAQNVSQTDQNFTDKLEIEHNDKQQNQSATNLSQAEHQNQKNLKETDQKQSNKDT